MTSAYSRRQMIVGAGALATAGVAWAAEPRRALVDIPRAAVSNLVPLRAGAWSGSEDPDVVPEQIDGTIDHGRTLTRRYVGPDRAPVMLVVSYHGPQSPDLKVHRPETCYTVAGFSGGDPRPFTAAAAGGVPAVAFTARREQRVETVLYWTRVADRFPQTLTQQRLDVLRAALGGVRADGLLFRASMVDAEPARALQVLDAFAAELVRSAPPRGRLLLVGPSAVHAA